MATTVAVKGKGKDTDKQKIGHLLWVVKRGGRLGVEPAVAAAALAEETAAVQVTEVMETVAATAAEAVAAVEVAEAVHMQVATEGAARNQEANLEAAAFLPSLVTSTRYLRCRRRRRKCRQKHQ